MNRIVVAVTTATALPLPRDDEVVNTNERIAVYGSQVHGRGVFAVEDLDPNERILAYAGELISWETAQARTNRSDAEASHTFFFDLGNGSVIDGGSGGNATGWINHGCEPNCAAELHDDQVVIFALRTIAAGEELLLDYQLQLDDGDEPPSAQDQRPTRASAVQRAVAEPCSRARESR